MQAIHEHASQPAHAPEPAAASTDPIAHLQRELDEARTKIDNLEIGLRSSREIGMAIGIIMARRYITADQAWNLLVSASQRTHRKLRDIASDVVFVGKLEI